MRKVRHFYRPQPQQVAINNCHGPKAKGERAMPHFRRTFFAAGAIILTALVAACEGTGPIEPVSASTGTASGLLVSGVVSTCTPSEFHPCPPTSTCTPSEFHPCPPTSTCTPSQFHPCPPTTTCTDVPNHPCPSTNSAPTAHFTWSCSGRTCSLNGSGSTGNISSHHWDLNRFPNPTASGHTVSVTYPHGGTRHVTLTVKSASGATHSVSHTLTVPG